MNQTMLNAVTARLIISSLLVLALTPGCAAPGKDTPLKKGAAGEKAIVSKPAAITYFADAEGSFSLTPPASVTGNYLRLAGTSAFPELAITARNLRTGGTPRQVAYRAGGREKFNFLYLIHDGPGNYSITIYGRRSLSDLRLVGLCTLNALSDENGPRMALPDINGQIVSFVNSVTGTTVGRGECWDLAQEALDAAGADWSRPFTFGTLLDPGRDRVLPGDIIQFRTVKIVERKPDGGTRWQILGAPDHTAVIVAVEGPKQFRLAHQNIEGKRSVLVTPVNLALVTSGTFWIYRPKAGIIR